MRALRVLPHSVRTRERAGMEKERELVLQARICVCENMTDICSGENVRGSNSCLQCEAEDHKVCRHIVLLCI